MEKRPLISYLTRTTFQTNSLTSTTISTAKNKNWMQTSNIRINGSSSPVIHAKEKGSTSSMMYQKCQSMSLASFQDMSTTRFWSMGWNSTWEFMYWWHQWIPGGYTFITKDWPDLQVKSIIIWISNLINLPT